MPYRSVGPHFFISSFYLSSEFDISFKDRVIIGPKIGTWVAGGAGAMGLGLNLIYYTDFNESSLRFRPEIGIGLNALKISYGYNFPVTNKDFRQINNNTISVVILINVKKLSQKNK